MQISNVKVYGLKESTIASGYPMRATTYSEDEFEKEILYLNTESTHVKRVQKLGSVSSGTGHDNVLKGIIVQFDLKAPEYFWRQFDRYHFHDYISSQSKMHCILKMNIKQMCNQYVDQRIIDILEGKIYNYNTSPSQQNFQYIISNCPMGFELTARITSNYLQEKSIHFQRKNHKLEEWNYYIEWQKTLPMFAQLIGVNNINTKEE